MWPKAAGEFEGMQSWAQNLSGTDFSAIGTAGTWHNLGPGAAGSSGCLVCAGHRDVLCQRGSQINGDLMSHRRENITEGGWWWPVLLPPLHLTCIIGKLFQATCWDDFRSSLTSWMVTWHDKWWSQSYFINNNNLMDYLQIVSPEDWDVPICICIVSQVCWLPSVWMLTFNWRRRNQSDKLLHGIISTFHQLSYCIVWPQHSISKYRQFLFWSAHSLRPNMFLAEKNRIGISQPFPMFGWKF